MNTSIPLVGVEVFIFNKCVVCEAPNGSRCPLGVGVWIRRRNGKKLKAKQMPKKRGAYPKSGARFVGHISDSFQQWYCSELYMPIAYGITLLLSAP